MGGHARVRSKCDEMIRRLSVVSVGSVFWESPFSPPLAPPRATHGRSSQPASGRRRLVRAPGARPLPRQPDEEPDDERRDDVPRRGGAQLAQPSSQADSRRTTSLPRRRAGAQLAREPEAARDVRLGDGAGTRRTMSAASERATRASFFASRSSSSPRPSPRLLLVLLLSSERSGEGARRARARRLAAHDRSAATASPMSSQVFRGPGFDSAAGARELPRRPPRRARPLVRRGRPLVVVASRLPRDARRGGGWFVPFGGGARGAHVDPGSVGRRGGARRRGRARGVGHVVARRRSAPLVVFRASCDQRSVRSTAPRTLRGAGVSRVWRRAAGNRS